MKVGIVGLGLSATCIHLPILKLMPEFELVAVVSTKSTAEIVNLVGQVEVFTEFEAFSASTSFDLAIVLTPNNVHFAHAKQLLHDNKHVVVDKPFTVNSTQARILQELALESNLMLSVFHNRRWDSDFLTIKRLMAENSLGKINYFESRFDKYHPKKSTKWKDQDIPGAGVLFDLVPHLADQVFVLFGLPKAVFAQIKVQRQGGIVTDCFNIKLIYPDVDVVLRSSSLAAVTPFRFYIEGSKGTFIKQHLDVQESRFREGLSICKERWVSEPEENFGVLYTNNKQEVIVSTQGDYRGFYRNIYNHLKYKEKLILGVEQAIAVNVLIEKVIKSSELSQVVNW